MMTTTKSTYQLSNRSIKYAIIIFKCWIAHNVKASSLLVSSIWWNMAQQNLHSDDTWMVFHQCEAFHTLSVRHSVQKSCHSGGNWMVFHECEAFHALSGWHSLQKSCHSSGTSIFFLNFSTWLNFTDWMSDFW